MSTIQEAYYVKLYNALTNQNYIGPTVEELMNKTGLEQVPTPSEVLQMIREERKQ